MSKMPYHKLRSNKERKQIYSITIKPSLVAAALKHTDNFSALVSVLVEEYIKELETKK